jgi:hypothetical protein
MIFPVDPLDRYAASMFFMDEKQIAKKINENR